MVPEGTREELGHEKNPVHVNVRENKWTVLSVLAAFSALAVSVFTLLFTLSPWGKVHAIEPSSYAIIRQDTLGSPGVTATTEHLVLPVEWKNDKGSSVLIRRLELTISELDGDGGTHDFVLVKEYPQLSGPAFKNDSDFRNSLTLESHSVSTRVLSFRSADGDFQFAPYTKYEARIRFLQNDGSTLEERPRPGKRGWQFCTYDTDSNSMIHTGDVQWNWWVLEQERNRSCQV